MMDLIWNVSNPTNSQFFLDSAHFKHRGAQFSTLSVDHFIGRQAGIPTTTTLSQQGEAAIMLLTVLTETEQVHSFDLDPDFLISDLVSILAAEVKFIHEASEFLHRRV